MFQCENRHQLSFADVVMPFGGKVSALELGRPGAEVAMVHTDNSPDWHV